MKVSFRKEIHFAAVSNKNEIVKYITAKESPKSATIKKVSILL